MSCRIYCLYVNVVLYLVNDRCFFMYSGQDARKAASGQRWGGGWAADKIIVICQYCLSVCSLTIFLMSLILWILVLLKNWSWCSNHEEFVAVLVCENLELSRCHAVTASVACLRSICSCGLWWCSRSRLLKMHTTRWPATDKSTFFYIC